MKSSKKIFILTEAVLAVMVVLAAAGMLWGRNGERSSKVSVIIRNSEDSRWAAFKYGLRMAAQDQGVEVVIANTGEVLTPEEEYETIEREISNGADAVVVQQVSGTDTKKMLKKIEKKVPVVLVECSVSGEDESSGNAVVKPDNDALGRALAEELLTDYSGKLEGKTVGIVSEGEISGAVPEREEGLCSILKEKGAQVKWTASVSPLEEEDEILERKSKVDFVVALDDYSLVLAGKAAEANNLHGALVYGIGNSMEAVYCLDTGFVRCLIVPDDFNMGYQSLTEVTQGLGHIFKKPESRTVSFIVMRRNDLFTKENQEILFTMSQ